MRVTKAHLTAHAAATDDSRPVLNAIHIDPKKMQTVSADGFRLLLVPLPPQDEGPDGIPSEGATLRLDNVLRAAKAIPGRRDKYIDNVYVYLKDGRAAVKIEHPELFAEIAVPLVDGTYPNYGIILENAVKGATHSVSLSLKFLASLIQQFKTVLGNSPVDYLVFRFGLPSSPVVIETLARSDLDNKRPAATAVLMPGYHPEHTTPRKGGWIGTTFPTEV